MKKITKLITFFILLLIIISTYKYINEKYNIGIPCIFHKITGLYCPGCGITRAFFALLELDITKAFHENALFTTCLPLVIIYITNWIKIWLNKEKKDASQIFPKSIWNLLLILTITFGIIRNINYFSWLQPI